MTFFSLNRKASLNHRKAENSYRGKIVDKKKYVFDIFKYIFFYLF